MNRVNEVDEVNEETGSDKDRGTRGSFRQLLRSWSVFQELETSSLTQAETDADPLAALKSQILRAHEHGEPEPHAMTLCTVDAAGIPSSRVLICKDVDERAVYFATSAHSRKAEELESTGVAAASFYWKRTGRQFRLVGRVERQPESTSFADFTARSETSRVAASVYRSTPPDSTRTVHSLASEVAKEPAEAQFLLASWRVYALIPSEAELWQGRQDRLHERMSWRWDHDHWVHSLLWP